MSWATAALGEIADVSSGDGAPQDSSAFADIGIPFIRAGSLAGLLSGKQESELEKISLREIQKRRMKIYPARTVVFAKSGMSSTKGLVYKLRGECCVVNHLATIQCTGEVTPEFVARWFEKNSPSRLVANAAYPSIKISDIRKELLPSPPLAEQKRIAEILDAADALRAKRRETLTQLDTLLQSTFIDMFGEPESEGWEITKVENVAQDRKGSIRTGPFGSQLLTSEFVDSGIAVLGIDNAVQNEFQWGERRFITPAKYRQLERYTVQPGDVLITIMGTCGRCAIVPEDIPNAINTKHLCCITLDQKKVLPQFLHSYFLLHPIARQYLSQSAKGAIMSGLNMGLIKAMPIPLAPLSLQEDYSNLAFAIERQKACCRAHLDELDALFASLQSRAFKGEL